MDIPPFDAASDATRPRNSTPDTFNLMGRPVGETPGSSLGMPAPEINIAPPDVGSLPSQDRPQVLMQNLNRPRVLPPGEVAPLPPDSLDYLRRLRVEIVGLQRLLTNVAEGASTLSLYSPLIRQNVKEIDALIPLIASSHSDDTIYEIANTWQTMKVSPLLASKLDPDNPMDAQVVLNQITILKDMCKQLIYLCGYLTIPSRLSVWLKKAAPGYYVPYNLVFENEVPDPADRAKILDLIAYAPKLLKGGLVDVTSGVVYKYSENGWWRLLSLEVVVLGLLGSIAFIIGLCNAFGLKVTGWPYSPANGPDLVGAWAALLAGVVVHMGVGAAKRAQARNQFPPIFAPTDFLARVNAQVGTILYRLLLGLIALFGLVGLLGMEQATAFNAFLTGYSLDSIIELVGAALDRQSSARIEALRASMGLNTQQ